MLINYIKIALKVLRRRKFFTFISLFGISFTLVVLMVATAVLDNAFAPRQPESKFDRVLGVYRVGMHGPNFNTTGNAGYRFLKEYVLGLPGAEAVSIFTSQSPLAMYHEGRKVETHLRRTDGAYWQILDFKFLEGGPYSAGDDEAGRPVAVINDDMREKLFDGKPALGKTFELEGRTFRVVGVVPRAAFLQLIAYSQIWVPIGTLKSADYRTQIMGGFNGAVLVRDRADIPAIRREFENRLTRVPLTDPKMFQTTRAGLDTTFESFGRMVIGNRTFSRSVMAKFVTVLFVLALMFMALPALNLITLNLSRIMERG
ncbi:MAG: ABC transporter permease, partial [Thermoanaerobaculia bacterium]